MREGTEDKRIANFLNGLNLKQRWLVSEKSRSFFLFCTNFMANDQQTGMQSAWKKRNRLPRLPVGVVRKLSYQELPDIRA